MLMSTGSSPSSSCFVSRSVGMMVKPALQTGCDHFLMLSLRRCRRLRTVLLSGVQVATLEASTKNLLGLAQRAAFLDRLRGLCGCFRATTRRTGEAIVPRGDEA